MSITCTPPAIHLQVDERPSADVCLTPVPNAAGIECSPNVGGDRGSAAIVTLGGEGPEDSYTATNRTLDSVTGLFAVDVCVNHTLFDLPPGNYQVGRIRRCAWGWACGWGVGVWVEGGRMGEVGVSVGVGVNVCVNRAVFGLLGNYLVGRIVRCGADVGGGVWGWCGGWGGEVG